MRRASAPCAAWDIASMRPANDPRNERQSIRRRLLWLLLVPTAAIAAAATYGAYRTALAPFEAAYDKALLDAALAIASNIAARGADGPALSLTPDAVSMLRSDSLDTIYYRVSGEDGHFIAGDRDLPVPHQGIENPEFDDLSFGGESIRLLSYRAVSAHRGFIISVAETRHKRDDARASVLRSSLAVDAAQLATALLVIWLGVGFAIEPLRNVERQIATRGSRDLEPLSTDGVPVEIRSLIDELNRLFGALREAEIAERSFLENAAHQLRTPLAGMLAQLELMAVDGAAVENVQARTALEGARRLARTTQQLLALARSDAASRTKSVFEAVSLPQVIKTCAETRLASADATGIDLGAELAPATVDGMAWMLEEALGNLADNAIAATPNGGSVTLRCGMAERRAWLEVGDTGVGIPVAERDHVLERFYRASNARAAGSGLGLAIVREVARLHRAALTIEDAAKGQGTRVRMTFPSQTSEVLKSLNRSPP
jgi:two-component system, OmpR family, sensor histidine kinase TctE